MAHDVSPDAIMQLGFAYWGSKTLLSAVELGLSTELAKGPLSVHDIRARLNLHERSMRDFLDALVRPDAFRGFRLWSPSGIHTTRSPFATSSRVPNPPG